MQLKPTVPQRLMKCTVPGLCFGKAVLLAPRYLVWESCSEISVAWKAEAFSEKRKERDSVCDGGIG